jgi:hypothetical protein
MEFRQPITVVAFYSPAKRGERTASALRRRGPEEDAIELEEMVRTEAEVASRYLYVVSSSTSGSAGGSAAAAGGNNATHAGAGKNSLPQEIIDELILAGINPDSAAEV